jgi:hypothetical protein
MKGYTERMRTDSGITRGVQPTRMGSGAFSGTVQHVNQSGV